MTGSLTRTYTGLLLAYVFSIAGCVLKSPISEPVPEPILTSPPDPIRESHVMRELPADMQKLSPGIRAALERDTDVIRIGDICETFRQPAAPKLQNLAQPQELLINFENRLPSDVEFEKRGFEQVRRGVEGWSVVLRSTQAESPDMSADSIRELAQDSRISHVEVNCIYPFEIQPRPVSHSFKPLENSCTVTATEPPPALFGFPIFPFDPLLVGGYLWGLEDIGAYEAWGAGYYSSNVPVAIIDSGVDYNHPELASNIWLNPIESSAGASPNVDDDSNGCVDDMHGCHFSATCVGGGSICALGDPMDTTGHGTGVASVLGSAMNATGMIGLTWLTNIIPVRVEISPTFFSKDVIENAIDYARLSGAKIVNLSFSHQDDASGGIQSAIARADDLLFVASAGTSFAVEYPAKFDNSNILSVSGYAHHDCNYPEDYCPDGPIHISDVDIAAPSHRICKICDGGYCEEGGTSFAAPFATGAAALVWSRWPYLRPEAVIQIIKNNAKPRDWLTGMNSTHGTLDIRFLALPIIRRPFLLGGELPFYYEY